MNKWIGCGRLTRNPEIRYTRDSKSVARFTLAVQNTYAKEGESTADYIDCVAFEKKADFIEKHAKQGTKLFIVGKLKTSSYINKDGNKVYTKDIVVEEIEFAESKNYDLTHSKEEPEPTPDNEGFMSTDGIQEELPFN